MTQQLTPAVIKPHSPRSNLVSMAPPAHTHLQHHHLQLHLQRHLHPVVGVAALVVAAVAVAIMAGALRVWAIARTIAMVSFAERQHRHRHQLINVSVAGLHSMVAAEMMAPPAGDRAVVAVMLVVTVAG